MSAALPALRFVALHEAGHAVADHRLGFTCMGCSIEANEETLGRAHAYDDDFAFAERGEDGVYDVPESATRNRVTVLLAGYCAAVAAGEDENEATRGAALDFEQAAGLRGTLPPPAGEADCLAVAFSFVREARNWAAIERVAAELLARRRLDGDELAILVDIADGQSTVDDLDRFRSLRDG